MSNTPASPNTQFRWQYSTDQTRWDMRRYKPDIARVHGHIESRTRPDREIAWQRYDSARCAAPDRKSPICLQIQHTAEYTAQSQHTGQIQSQGQDKPNMNLPRKCAPTVSWSVMPQPSIANGRPASIPTTWPISCSRAATITYHPIGGTNRETM